ncbi:uncharacterized protein LOC131066088 [Cryptomeria japonica]|uniref:uncharacterized protein LOC131066088 n=1 Tax=Cryptomeria japonica TaxID=3369 RepID=UPI0027DA51FC|nr:uncharacterized protein LOC131066088 [Cryptomeria japonica]
MPRGGGCLSWTGAAWRYRTVTQEAAHGRSRRVVTRSSVAAGRRGGAAAEHERERSPGTETGGGAGAGRSVASGRPAVAAHGVGRSTRRPELAEGAAPEAAGEQRMRCARSGAVRSGEWREGRGATDSTSGTLLCTRWVCANLDRRRGGDEEILHSADHGAGENNQGWADRKKIFELHFVCDGQLGKVEGLQSRKACAEYQSLGPLDWDFLSGVIDSGMTNEYVIYVTAHKFPRLTCPDETEHVLEDDDERLQCRAPRRSRDGGERGGGGRDDGGDGGDEKDRYEGDAGDHGGGDNDGGDDDGGDDDRGDSRALAGAPRASSSRSARDVYMNWMTRVVRRRRLGPVDQGHQVPQ